MKSVFGRFNLLMLGMGTLLSNVVLAQSPSETAVLEYDALGNLRLQRNGLLLEQTHEYDALSRLKVSIDANKKRTQFDYDLGDQLTKVTDPRNVATGYAVDGLGKLIQTDSRDTGITVEEYDEAGNVLTSTDAKKQTTRFDYDALNRLKLVTYADGTTESYLYDQNLNATGRLSKITDASGATSFEYDAFGNLVSEIRTIDGSSYTTGYRYDDFGRLAGLDYPSGRSVTYGRDPLGRISSITTQKGGVVKTILADVTYQPFGGAVKITFGNGRKHTRSYDLDGRLASYSLRNQTISLGYDAGGRLRTITPASAPANVTKYDYDNVDRLKSVITPTSSQVYGYDDAGNRTSKQINGTSKSLTYSPTSNRLAAVGAQQVVTDDNGRIVNRGDGTFTYDVRGRLISFQGLAGLVKYTINGLGQRVKKMSPTTTKIFHYDAGGKLIAESTTEGGITKIQEYIYLGDLPVAVLK